MSLSINGKWGYVDSSGEFVIKPQFDEALPFKENLAAVKIDGLWGYINNTGSVCIKPQFKSNFYFSQDYAKCKIGDKWGYVDKFGKVTTFSEGVKACGNFCEGLAYINYEGKFGYINRNMEFVIPPKYTDARDFANGLAPVNIVNSDFASDNALWGYIDKTGEFKYLKPQYHDAYRFSEGLAVVNTSIFDFSPEYGFINEFGYLINVPEATYMVEFSEGLALVELGDKGLGYINREGNLVIGPYFYSAKSFRNGLAEVTISDLNCKINYDKTCYINKLGEFIWPRGKELTEAKEHLEYFKQMKLDEYI